MVDLLKCMKSRLESCNIVLFGPDLDSFGVRLEGVTVDAVLCTELSQAFNTLHIGCPKSNTDTISQHRVS